MIINSIIGFSHPFGDGNKNFKFVCCFNGPVEFRFNVGWSPTGIVTSNFLFDCLGTKDPVETVEYTKRR